MSRYKVLVVNDYTAALMKEHKISNKCIYNPHFIYKDGRQDLGPGRSSLNRPPQKSIILSLCKINMLVNNIVK